MAAPLGFSTRKINPLTPSSAMRRAAGKEDARAKTAQFSAQIQQVRKDGSDALIQQQPELANLKTTSIFPQLANLLIPQMASHFKVLSMRVQAYEAVAESNVAEDTTSTGQRLDLYA